MLGAKNRSHFTTSHPLLSCQSPFSLFLTARQTQPSFMCFRGETGSVWSLRLERISSNTPQAQPLLTRWPHGEAAVNSRTNLRERLIPAAPGPVSLPRRNEGQDGLTCERWVMETVIWTVQCRLCRIWEVACQWDSEAYSEIIVFQNAVFFSWCRGEKGADITWIDPDYIKKKCQESFSLYTGGKNLYLKLKKETHTRTNKTEKKRKMLN